MEARLREYRAQRRREELVEKAEAKIDNTKEKFLSILVPKIFNMMKEKAESEMLLMEHEETLPLTPPPPPVVYKKPVVKKPLIQPEETVDVASQTGEDEMPAAESTESWKYFIVKWSLYTIIWISVYIYFLSLQFGAVFFTVSVLLGIYFNTRTRPKKKGEVSAYSVFNDNCQSINGTLKAEELERQMMYGAAGVRAF